MNVTEAIKTRRSIRKFKPDPIPDDDIRKLIDAGRLAPSGVNLQPTRYAIIKSAEARDSLKACTPLPFVPEAPCVIACCIDTHTTLENGGRVRNLDDEAYNAYLQLNAAIAIDHITLQAVELGLGTCWIMMFDKSKVKQLLGLDEQYDIVALLPVGYPDQDPSPRPRLDSEQLILKEI
jgi:nitroreductase